MFKRKIAWLCAVILIVGCFTLVGCGNDEEDKASWNGTYYGRTMGDKSKQEYTDTEVIVDDGYMSVNIVKHFINSEGEPDIYKREGEGEFKDGDDEKSIVIAFEGDMYNAELRKMAGKYFLSIKDSNDGDVDDKYEVEKNAKKQPEVSMSQVPTTKKAETTKVEETKAKKPKKAKKAKKKSSVSSDFKDTMDDYEDFIDDYVAFMKKYKNASAADQASMLTDYSEMMSKYSELSSEMANMESNLSGDELAYYTKVMARVAKKLAKVQ